MTRKVTVREALHAIELAEKINKKKNQIGPERK